MTLIQVTHNINSVEIEIGGQRIDKQFGHWMETWFELTEPNPSGTLKVTMPHPVLGLNSRGGVWSGWLYF